MNTKGNKRHQESLQRIYTAFDALLREQELSKISVTALFPAKEKELLEQLVRKCGLTVSEYLRVMNPDLDFANN